MPDDIAAFKAALARVMALADKALDAKLVARKPKPAPEPEPVEPDGDEPMPEDGELTDEEKEKLASLYADEE